MTRLRAYWATSAALLSALAGIGFYAVARHTPVVAARDVLVFDTTQNVAHAVLAAVSLVMAFVPDRFAMPGARVAGISYLGLAALGFVSGSLFGLGTRVGLRLELAENGVHLALGAWGTLVGYQTKKRN